MMIDNFRKNNGLTLDTCFVIQAYKNPGIASFYLQKGFYGCKIFINEIVFISSINNSRLVVHLYSLSKREFLSMDL